MTKPNPFYTGLGEMPGGEYPPPTVGGEAILDLAAAIPKGPPPDDKDIVEDVALIAENSAKAEAAKRAWTGIAETTEKPVAAEKKVELPVVPITVPAPTVCAKSEEVDPVDAACTLVQEKLVEVLDAIDILIKAAKANKAKISKEAIIDFIKNIPE